MKNNPNDHIANYLDYYLKLTSPPEFAILLRGNWGCGKTWFLKHYIQEKKKAGTEFIYISLYGITSYQEIENSIFEQLHPILSSKGMKLASTVLKGLLKYSLKIDFDKNNATESSVSSEIPDINLPSYFQNLDNRILVFDDLERCSINIKDMLGYINQFSENKFLKVIILANEEEIIKTDTNKESFSYLKIKEKLIGKSFTVKPDLEKALESFIDLIPDQKVKKFLKSNQETIMIQYQNAGYNNLRHLKQAILDFNRFYSCVPSSAFKKTDLMRALVDSFFAITFELKNGIITENEIPKIFSFNFSNPGTPKDRFQIIKGKYPIFNFYQHPFDLRIWTEYFTNAGVNSDAIKQSIESSPYYEKDRMPDWLKLWKHINLEDKEFEDLITHLYHDFLKKNIPDPPVIIHLAGLFFFFSEIKLAPYDKKEILKKGKENINKLRKKLVNYNIGVFPGDSWYGYQYQGLDIPEFRELLNYAGSILSQETKKQFPDRARLVLEALTSSLSDFEELLTITRSGQNRYYNIPILSYLPPEVFVDTVFKMKNSDIIYVADILAKRYGYVDIRKDLKEELDWLKNVNDLLKQINETHQGKLSGLRIDHLIGILYKSIDLLQTTIN
jgi:hypothetical protein